MRKSISVAFFSLVSTLMVLGIVLMGASEWVLFKNYFAKDRYETLDQVVGVTQRTAQYLVQQAELPEGDELDALSTKLEIIGESAEAYLFFTDNDGRVMIASSPDKLESLTVPEEMMEKIDTADADYYHVFGTLDGMLDGKSYITVSEMRNENGQPSGYLFLCSSGEQLTQFKQQFWSNFLLSACVMLLCASILTKILMRQLTDPLQKVTDAAQRFGGGDLSVRDVHAQHGGVERDARTVLHGVFRVGDRQPVGADAAGVRVGDGEAGLFIEVRLAPEQFPAGDEAGVRDAVVVFAPHAVAPHGGAQPAVLEADVLPHAGKRHVELLADLVEHGVAAPDVFVLDAAAAEVDARMHLAVVAPGGAEREVTLLVDDQDVELLARKFARDRHARDAAADDEHVGRLPVERVVAQRGHAHGRVLSACERDVVDDMARGILRCSHLAGAHNVVPAVKRAAQDDAVVLRRRCDAAAEGFAQFSVQNGDPHNRGASQMVSRSADRLNRSNIPFFRRKVKNGVCGKSAEIFLSY